jgi:hypothetical protein
MADISKISPDDGSTILNVKDRNAVHWSESKGYVGKNLLNNIATSQTINGVTFTVNADKSVTVNGTASATTNLELINTPLVITENCILTGTPSGGQDKYRIMANNGSTWFYDVTGVILPSGTYTRVLIQIVSGQTINNLVFKPMIRLSSISDSTYEPYLTPNTEIDNKLSYADNAVLGAKNLLINTGDTVTTNGITFTVNSDGSINVNGTATENAFFTIGSSTKYLRLDSNTNYILSGCPSGGATNTYKQDIRTESSGTTVVLGDDVGDGVIFSTPNLANVNQYQAVIRIQKGYTANNLVFKPMIRIASDTDETFFKGAMSNRQLTENIVKQKKVTISIDPTKAIAGNSEAEIFSNFSLAPYISDLTKLLAFNLDWASGSRLVAVNQEIQSNTNIYLKCFAIKDSVNLSALRLNVLYI